MTLNILHIDSSPRGAVSLSRRLTAEFVHELQKKNSDAAVIYRDLGHEPPPFVNENWISGGLIPDAEQNVEQRAALVYSDAAIDELFAADVIAIGSPMYNFGISAALKAYIDQIVRAKKTFAFSPEGIPSGLVPPGKKLFVFTARGGSGYEPGEPYEKVNHQDVYLRDIFGFLGITDVKIIHANNTQLGEQAVEEAVNYARTQIHKFAAA